MNITPQQQRALFQQAVVASWHLGRLDYKFHETQDKIYEALQNTAARKFFLLCSRRLGKSFLLVCLAFETALRKPHARVLYLAPQQRDASDIAGDLAAQILFDCPPALRPEFNAQTKEFRFKNGSIVRLKGVNNERADYLRGGAADLVILDECGLMDNLSYVVQSVCLPMVLTTGGKILLASTPPATPAHDSAAIYEDLASENAVVSFTLLDAPHIPRTAKAEILREAGEKKEDVDAILNGKASPRTSTARRELFCEFIVDSSLALVPEFDAGAQKEIIVEHPKPKLYRAYTAIDPGARDKHGMLFAYVDFLKGKLVVEDESLLTNPPTRVIADTIKEKESSNWGTYADVVRVSDIDIRMITDLHVEYKLAVRKAPRVEILTSVNRLRHAIQTRRIIISPKCVNLIRQLKTCIWNSRATDMDRAGESSPDAHFDLVAALRTMLAVVDFSHNPYPDHYYERGGELGPSFNQWSPKSRKPRRQKLSLSDNTPAGRRLGKTKPKKKFRP